MLNLTIKRVPTVLSNYQEDGPSEAVGCGRNCQGKCCLPDECQVVEVEAVNIMQLQLKLKDMLKNLCSVEVSLYSKASKDFVRLLKGEAGADYLCHYIQSSANCVELLEAWKLHQGKPEMASILSLITTILEHHIGKFHMNRHISRNLDHLARLIVLERLDDVYVELKCGDLKRQSAMLSLLASIVRRGMSLASEVASKFDFKLPILVKLSRIQKMKVRREARKYSTRSSFVDFAMSFLEVGNPRLMRWILQQRALYFGVLQGLGSDDSDTVLHVLSILRDKVLSVGSFLPPGLRSVLFGIVTLEQLSLVSGNQEDGPAADLAHEVLLMVCTDPCNGLMPSSKLKGNPTRLLELMKKLKSTESKRHKDLLLAIVKGRPSLCSLFMENFPYSLEPSESPLWFSAISLAADLISSVNSSSAVNLVTSSLSHDLPDLDNYEMQCILKCIFPRSFTRSVSNKGLLHSSTLVNHGSLRLLLTMLKSLHNLLVAIDRVAEQMSLHRVDASDTVHFEINSVPGLRCFGFSESHILCDRGDSQSDQSLMLKWLFFKEGIQDKARTILPDPQVLLNLFVSFQKMFKPFSSLSCKSSGGSRLSLKRASDLEKLSHKRLRPNKNSINDGIDIVISGVSLGITSNKVDEDIEENIAKEMGEEVSDIMEILGVIWGNYEDEMVADIGKMDAFFYVRLLDAIAYYMRTIPKAMDGTFDFFKILPSEPSSLSFCQQKSLLSLLVECIGQSPVDRGSVRSSHMMYKYLQPLINILIHSQEVYQHEAYVLARSAMISTGAFNNNLSEIDVWFIFLSGQKKNKYFTETKGIKVHRDLPAVVISFLCDAISTLGNNLYKHMCHMHYLISHLRNLGENSLNFSPLVIVVIQKCLRLLESESGSFSLPEKTLISLYVCNTLSFLVQSQVEGHLPGLIDLLLSERLSDLISVSDGSNSTTCEWRPLKKLLNFARDIYHQQTCDKLFHVPATAIKGNGGSLYKVLGKVEELLEDEPDIGLVGVSMSLASSILCATPNDIMCCFPLLVRVAQHLVETPMQCLLSVLFLEWDILSTVSDIWPDMPFSALDSAGGAHSNIHECKNANFSSDKEPDTATCLIPVSTNYIDSSESMGNTFKIFLEHASFCSIFTSFFSLCSYKVSLSTTMLNLLQDKVSCAGFRDSILSLRVVLFWAHQIRSSYNVKPSDHLERLFKICSALIECILEHILVIKYDTAISVREGRKSKVDCVKEVAELIILHPYVNQSLSNPLCNESLDEIPCYDLGNINVLSKQSLHATGHSALRLFNRVADSLSDVISVWKAASTISSESELIVKEVKKVIQLCLDSFREKFSLSTTSKNWVPLLPSFCVLHGLIRFISPSCLLELVYWMLCRVEDHLIVLQSQKLYILSVALCIADDAFKLLSSVLYQQNKGYQLFWEMTGRTYPTCLLQNVFLKILHVSTCFNLELADKCLLSAVDTIYGLGSSQPNTAFLPFNILMLKIIISSPIEIVKHCTYNTNKIKVRLLHKIIQTSSLHSRFFGMIFFDIMITASLTEGKMCKEPSSDLGNKLSFKDAAAMKSSNFVFTKEDFVLLLPAALYFLTNNLLKHEGCNHETRLRIPAFYARILLDGFSNWNNYVSLDIFHEDYVELFPKQEDFPSVFHSTLLGKAVLMMQYFFNLGHDSVKRKQRLKYFDSIYQSNELLSDLDVLKINAQSYVELFDFVNKVIAKISFTWLLLFSQEDQPGDLPALVDSDSKVMATRNKSKREKHAKLKFMNVLIGALNKIVKKTSSRPDLYAKLHKASWLQLLQFLEISIIRTILRLATEVGSFISQSTSIPFLKPFIKSSLSHRFDDPFTLKAIHSILTIFKDGVSITEILDLVLGHSKFVSIILSRDSCATSSSLAQTGTFLQAIPSICKLVDSALIQRPLNSEHPAFDLRSREYFRDNTKLELVKLLRFLYQHVTPKYEMSVSMNSRELVSLLLSGYGASLDETDLEIFHLLLEVEAIGKLSTNGIADMDYLWGSSALEIRKELTADKLVNGNQATDCETIQDKSRRLFRENILVDSKRCAFTVLNFCYERSKLMSCKSLERPSQYDLMYTPQTVDSQQSSLPNLYDPSFILKFSINSLSKGYIEPVEFTQLGLLAISIISISSLDTELRTMGYEVLGCFQKALMDCKKSNDVVQLQLLLAYLQNGITEPWQRIPSICTLFAAEASFILLDTSHDHFQTTSKFLLRSPKMDLKDVPLFHTFFGSSSMKFKSEHLWILKLIYAGLNVDEDAQILMNKFVIEILLSFHSSSLSSTEAKVIILQILKKSVKLHVLACRLVMSSGLLSWLYHLILYYGERLCGDQKDFSMRQLEIILEVIIDVVSIRIISKYLKNEALEQLSKISSHLHSLALDSLALLKESTSLVNSIFCVIATTLKISQKRKVYQPHFSFSLEGILKFSQVISRELNHTSFGHTAELGLTTLLMCTPPAVIFRMDKAKLADVVFQAIPFALPSSCRKAHVPKEPDVYMLSQKSFGDQANDESLLEKLLRWTSASVILGFISTRCSDVNASFQISQVENLQLLLESTRGRHKEDGGGIEEDCSSNTALAAIILHLQLLTGRNVILPSVILALCLLLFHNEVHNNSVQGFLVDNPKSYIPSLCSKIHCPAEVNPAWRWSFHEPWRDRSNNLSNTQTAQERNACQVLLLAFSCSLAGDSSASAILSQEDLERLFLWERKTILDGD